MARYGLGVARLGAGESPAGGNEMVWGHAAAAADDLSALPAPSGGKISIVLRPHALIELPARVGIAAEVGLPTQG